MRLLISSLVFSLSTMSYPSFAGDDCMDKAMTQMDIGICAGKEYDAEDAKLNRTYKKLQKKYADETVFLEKLKKAQQAWIKFRDAEIEAHFPVANGGDPYVEYGSMYPTLVSSLMVTLTRQRTKQLIELLELGFGIEQPN